MSTTIQEREATSVTSPVKGEPVAEPLYPELLEAARLIRRDGWWGKGAPCVTGREYCIGQSARAAYGLSPSGDWDTIGQRLGFSDADALMAWNDASDRTLAEVLERLTLAAHGEFEA